MKKTLLIIVLIIISYLMLGNFFSEKIIIPDEAIRIRVIANSDSDYDQKIKLEVKNELEKEMKNIYKETEDINSFRTKILDSLNIFEKDIEKVLEINDYPLLFDIKYGLNYFPQKRFKGVTYNEGYYESLVVTLGEGLGENWWCVLFPPLCLIEASDSTELEYTTMVKEVLNKYFK